MTVVFLNCFSKCSIELYMAERSLSLKTEKWKAASMIPERPAITETIKSDTHTRQICRRKKNPKPMEGTKKIDWVKSADLV